MKEKQDFKKKIKADYSKFVVGDIFVGIISSFESPKIFHVVRDEDLELIQMNAELNPMWWFPVVNDTFYVFSENNIIRCARLPLDEQQLDSSLDLDLTAYMNLYLQDTGESFIIPVDQEFGTRFVMPEPVSKIPGLAVKCTWNEIGVDLRDDCEKTFLQNNVYGKFTFEVIKVTNGMLTVDIFPYDDNSQDESIYRIEYEELEKSSSQETSAIMNRQYEKEFEGVDLNLMPIKPSTPEPSLLQSQESQDYQVSNQSSTFVGISKELMTPEELKAWYEIEMNTEEPQKAVNGFKTSDDDRRCRFYDPALGGCFKGGRCKQIHLSELTDGTVRDRQEICYNNIPKSLPVPAMGTNIKIQVTFVKSFRILLCRYIDKRSTKDTDIEALTDHMNSKNQVDQYKQLTEYPVVKELVIVKYNDRFYRGQIEALTDSDSVFVVLLVDHGILEKVNMKNLFFWSQRFVYLPFQTIEIAIANIQPFVNNEFAAKNKLIDLIEESGSDFNALVVENFCDIECVLFNNQHEDIGKKLIDGGFVVEKALKAPIAYNREIFYPG